MQFGTDQKSEPHRGFLLQFNTDFKAVISYLIHLRLLILQARTITVIAIVVSKNNNSDVQNGHFKQRMGINEHRYWKNNSRRKHDINMVASNLIWISNFRLLVHRFCHVLTNVFVALHLNIIFPEVCTKILLLSAC